MRSPTPSPAPDRVGRVFAALSDPTRRAILERLSRGPAAATELAEPFRISQPAVSKHLRVLREAGLIRKRVHGRNHWCRLEAAPMREASEWIDRYRVFWQEQFQALAGYLGEGEEEAARPRAPATRRRRTKRTGDTETTR